MIDLPPILTHFDKRRQHLHKTVQYNSTGQKVDIWRPAHLTGPAPVLLFIPGGAWVWGDRRGQGHALMSHLVDNGWICLSIDYRTAPRNRWPIPFIDVKHALAWAAEHVHEYGGDPNFIAVAGASAGGHMASLLGLAWDYQSFYTHPMIKPNAVVSLYGVYDWRRHRTPYHWVFNRVIQKVIVGKPQGVCPEVYREASPLLHIRPDAPPFMIVHGTSDVLTPVQGARHFHKSLAATADEPPIYYEMPGAHHAFDLINLTQTQRAVRAVHGFLVGARLRTEVKKAS
jgi:acetyl esterase/lipase